MERFVDLSLADLGRTVYRYRPVAAAAAAVVVLGLALPGPREVGQDLSRFATGAPQGVPATQTPASATEGVVEAAADAPVDDAPADATFGSSTAAFGSPSAISSGSSTFTSPASSSDSGVREDTRASSTPVSAPPSAPAPSTASAPAIVTTLWASRMAGTPLAANGVPVGSLPVGKAVGQDDKLAFLRLSDRPARLVLRPHAEGQRSPETALLQACLIKTTGWKGGEAVAFDAAPERDCTVAVQGARAEDGSWSFDLRPFEGRSGDGLALVPAPGAPLDFQVAFVPALS